MKERLNLTKKLVVLSEANENEEETFVNGNELDQVIEDEESVVIKKKPNSK